MHPQNKLLSFYKKRRRMPSYGELTALLGYKSKGATQYAVQKLLDEGVISKDKKGKLIPRNLMGAVSLLGTIEAGFPSPAEEELVDTMSLDDFLIKNKEATFMLKVKGDSMIDAGIMEGDMVLVERGKTPKLGQIVIAEVDGEYTMKYYRKDKGKVYLQAANKKYKDIYPENKLIIEAVVQAVIRKY